MRLRCIIRFGTLGLLAACILVLSCGKERNECPLSSSSPDGRDQFVGQYKVYDTTGTFLYDMEIMKTNDPDKDSLYAVNWGSRFNMFIRHEDGDYTNYLNYNPPFPSQDHQGRRWAFFQEVDASFHSNLLVHDTLRMSYRISNIAFYVDDGVPFFEWSYREYGVKQ